jgi:ribonuclease BN (tRNA processing enzyme)
MRLRVLGSSGTYPTPGRPASGYLLDHGGTHLLLDAGPATFGVLQTHVAPSDLDAVVLSHVHGDHCLDVFPLLSALRYGSVPKRGLPVFAPPGVAERIAGFAGAGPDHALYEIFDFRAVSGGDSARIGYLDLAFGDAAHSVPSLISSIAAGGRRMVYSGDTGPGGDLVSLARGADLLLCEATSQGPPSDDDYPYHLSALQAGAAARDAGVGRLLLTHLAPGLDPGVSVDEASEAFGGPIEWAAPGLEVMV